MDGGAIAFGAVAGLLAVGFLVAFLRTRDRLAAVESSGAAAEARAVELEQRVVEREAALADAERALAAAHLAAAPVVEDDDALVDPETGLFGETYFGVTLASRVAAARRHLRPVAVVFIDVVEGLRDGTPRAAAAGHVADHVRTTLREADTACRLADGRFALVLEDTPENGAVWTVERIRRSLATTDNGLTLWAGIACYPAHAFDATELRERAAQALDAAGQWRQDRIEVATSAD